MHASMGGSTGQMLRRAKIIGCLPVSKIPSHPIFEQLSQQNPDSSFTHHRFSTKSHGKLLAFSTGNIIRAGKSTHADAFHALLAFLRWCRALNPKLHGMWPMAVSMPNSVWSGQFNTSIDRCVLDHSVATHSDRFPGISLNFQNTNITSKITPELFLKESKWIVPGVKDIVSLFNIVQELTTLHVNCATRGQILNNVKTLDI